MKSLPQKIKLAGEHTPSEDVVPSTDRKGSIHELQDPGNPSLEDVMSVMLSEQSSQEFKANVCRAYLVAVEEKSAKQRLLGGMKVSVDGEKTGNGMASREGSGDGEIDDLPTTPKTTTALNRSVNLNGSGMVRIEENTTRGRDREAQATRPSATPTSRPPFGPLADKIQHPRQTTPSTVAGQKRAHSDFREPICVSCWRTGTPCDRRPQCRSCIDRGMLCVHMRCSGHSNCKNENCPHLHPAQYDERDSRWDVRNGELPGYKGQSSRYAEKRQKY